MEMKIDWQVKFPYSSCTFSVKVCQPKCQVICLLLKNEIEI